MANAKSFDQIGNSPVTRVHSPAPVHRIVDDRVSEVLSNLNAEISLQYEFKDSRPRLSSDQIQVLNDHFAEKPKPGTEVKKQLAEQLGLSLQRVNNWYQNRRAKARHAGIQRHGPGPSTSDIFASHLDEEVLPHDFPKIKDQRLVTDLHVCCLCVFDMFRQLPAAFSFSFKDSDRDIVDEQVGRLFLWGQGFNPEKLEDALDQSKELREIVLESLCEIGKLIIPHFSPQTEEILASRGYQEDDLARRLQELNTLISQAQSSLRKNSLVLELASDNEGDDALEDVSSEDDAEVSENGVNLEFHVQCLMDLIPSLQQNIAHAEKSRPKISNPEVICSPEMQDLVAGRADPLPEEAGSKETGTSGTAG